MADTVLQFESAAAVVRLNLNDPDNGFFLDPGIDIGFADVAYEWLQQAPYEALLAGWMPLNRSLRIPVGIRKHVTAATRGPLIDTLLTELARETNILRYQPPDWPFQYLIDTYVAPEPEALSAWMHEFATEKVGVLNIPAKAYLRKAA